MLQDYIKYLIQRKGAQSIHSPFIYDLFQNVIRKKPRLNSDHKGYISQIKSSSKVIKVDDFGAGSRVFKKDVPRPVKKIHKYSSSSVKKGHFLYRLVRNYQMNNILELGTCLGVGSMFMASGMKKDGCVFTIEGDPNLFEFTKKLQVSSGFEGIENLHGKFIDVLPKEIKSFPKMDLIFVDGHHDGKATLEYIDLLKPLIKNDTILILDDIYWSESMKQMWNNVIASEQFHVSIDLFDVGLLMKRPEQKKEHFILKF